MATSPDRDSNRRTLSVAATVLFLAVISSKSAHGAESPAEPALTCLSAFAKVAAADQSAAATSFCKSAEQLTGCASHEGRPIHHLDFTRSRSSAPNKPEAKAAQPERRILVFGLIHGDEPLSGRLALEWAMRLQTIDPRNSWRVVPLLNPDGLERLTRANARGVDLNRNFPTRDWDAEAAKHWNKSQSKDPRRYPGASGGSEPETQCALAHIKDFNPDFVVSIHTPYAVLDFDGPKMPFPSYRPLPWRALGNFPGSLGRYMWKDHGLPVLTIELKDKLIDPASIQDVVGRLAIDAAKRSPQRNASWADAKAAQ